MKLLKCAGTPNPSKDQAFQIWYRLLTRIWRLKKKKTSKNWNKIPQNKQRCQVIVKNTFHATLINDILIALLYKEKIWLFFLSVLLVQIARTWMLNNDSNKKSNNVALLNMGDSDFRPAYNALASASCKWKRHQKVWGLESIQDLKIRMGI